MQSSNAPGKIVLPFANGGDKNAIPVTSSDPSAASLTLGFPVLTGTPVESGGTGPSRLDFNGVFNASTALDRWYSAGASFLYDATFSAAIGGYPLGARLLRVDGAGYWRSTAENNTTNPETGGAGWASDGVTAAASVYLAGQQTMTAGVSKVLFDTVEFDARGLWDATNKRFKALYAGLYRVNGAIALNAPDPQPLATEIWRNGAVAKQCYQSPQVSDVNLTLPFGAVLNLAINDYVEINLIHSGTVVAGYTGNNRAFVYAQIEYMG